MEKEQDREESKIRTKVIGDLHRLPQWECRVGIFLLLKSKYPISNLFKWIAVFFFVFFCFPPRRTGLVMKYMENSRIRGSQGYWHGESVAGTLLFTFLEIIAPLPAQFAKVQRRTVYGLSSVHKLIEMTGNQKISSCENVHACLSL